MDGVHPLWGWPDGNPQKGWSLPFQNNESMKDNSIHFFNSLKEMSDDHYSYLATLSPEQHLQNALIHIKQIYADELLKNTDSEKEIIFDSI
jgi:hypothetical protein